MKHKLIHSVFVKNEAHCISNMLESILPYVGASYILVDDTTTDNTREIAKSHGCNVKDFKFENFGKAQNTLFSWVKDCSYWSFNMAPDETISKSFGENLLKLIDEHQNDKVDGFHFPRRHWLDLEMQNEYTEAKWYPDVQLRLLRNDYPRIHTVKYVHEPIVGLRGSVVCMKFDLNHFNLYWKGRMDYTLDKMNTLYKSLMVLEKQEGGKNIWPDGD